jgi:Zn finger protein HypA/HybF involved in hydrogenase expression
MTYTAEMMFEEIDLLMRSGNCPRCNSKLNFDVSEDDWEAVCPGCKTTWGGSI